MPGSVKPSSFSRETGIGRTNKNTGKAARNISSRSGKTVAPSKKTTNKISLKLDKGAIAVGIIILILAGILVSQLIGSSKVKQITVQYTDAARQKAMSEGLTDEDFIRNSGIMNRKMSEIDQWTDTASDNISHMPGFLLNRIKKVSTSSIQMEIAARTPYAVLSTGSGYITIDENKYIIAKKTSYGDGESILVDGISLRNPNVGQIAVDTSTDNKLENVLNVIDILNKNNLRRYFTTVHMLSGNEIQLVSTYDISVIINLWFKDSFTDDLTGAVQVLNEKGSQRLTGWIYAVNGNITWHEDADYFSPIKGK